MSNANLMMYNVLTNNGNLNIEQKDSINKINFFCTDKYSVYKMVKEHSLFKDNINKHITAKSETCLVESYNSSLRTRLNRLCRKTKGFSKNESILELSVRLWANMKQIFRNIERYCLYWGDVVINNY